MIMKINRVKNIIFVFIIVLFSVVRLFPANISGNFSSAGGAVYDNLSDDEPYGIAQKL